MAHRVLILSEIKPMVDEGRTADHIRRKLNCGLKALRTFMSDNGLAENICPERQEAARILGAEIAAKRIALGRGGDVAFAALMAGRQFDRMKFASDARTPRLWPHKIPGDDHSTSGSSMLHVAGNTGIRISAGGGR